jgi:hypothetical protein
MIIFFPEATRLSSKIVESERLRGHIRENFFDKDYIYIFTFYSWSKAQLLSFRHSKFVVFHCSISAVGH